MTDPSQSATSGPQSDEPGVLAALGGLLLVGLLVAAIMFSWYDPQSAVLHNVASGEILLYQGRYTEAIPLIEHALPFESNPQTHLLLSYLYLARRDTERAETQARVAVSNASGSLVPAAWSQLGRVYALSGRQRDAEEAWSKAVENSRGDNTAPAVRSAMWQLAMSRWRSGDFNAATVGLKDLAGGDDVYAISASLRLAQYFAPTDEPPSLRYLANAEALMKTPQGEVEQVSPADMLTGAIPDLRLPNLREGFSSGAITNLIALLRSAFSTTNAARAAGAPESVIWAVWGSSYLTQGETMLAKTYLEKAESAQPASSDIRARLGLALLAAGDADAAIEQLLTSVRLDANNSLPRHALVSIYMSRKDWDNAVLQLRALRKLEPDAIAPRMEVAEYYRQHGQYDEAEANLVEATQVQKTFGPKPGDVDTSLSLSRFYTDVRGQGCARGLPAAQDSVTQHPDDPDSLDALGWALVLCRDGDAAIKPLERSIAAAPEVPRFRYHLAKAYVLSGRYTDARSEYIRVMDLDPGGPWEKLAQTDVVALGDK